MGQNSGLWFNKAIPWSMAQESIPSLVLGGRLSRKDQKVNLLAFAGFVVVNNSLKMWKTPLAIWSYKLRPQFVSFWPVVKSVCNPNSLLWPFSLFSPSPPLRDLSDAHCLPPYHLRGKEACPSLCAWKWHHTGLCVSTPNTTLNVQSPGVEWCW